jgi:hypothetical protein
MIHLSPMIIGIMVMVDRGRKTAWRGMVCGSDAVGMPPSEQCPHHRIAAKIVCIHVIK